MTSATAGVTLPPGPIGGRAPGAAHGDRLARIEPRAVSTASFRSCLERAARTSASGREKAPPSPDRSQRRACATPQAPQPEASPDAVEDDPAARGDRARRAGRVDDVPDERAAVSPPPPAPHPEAGTGAPPVGPSSWAGAATSLEDLMTTLVRRAAWWGDRRQGTARLEIGAGALAGATLWVHADGERVRVQLDVPAGVDAAAWHDRIVRGLAARRIRADEVQVT
jgi:hypothetical protein